MDTGTIHEGGSTNPQKIATLAPVQLKYMEHFRPANQIAMQFHYGHETFDALFHLLLNYFQTETLRDKVNEIVLPRRPSFKFDVSRVHLWLGNLIASSDNKLVPFETVTVRSYVDSLIESVNCIFVSV
jgi:hypothetical protein